MTRSGYENGREMMLSEYRQRRCRCHVWWKTVPEGGAGNRRSSFADGRQVEQW